MKKAIALVLTLAMCLSLCACGKSKAVKDVEDAIDAIGEVSLDSEAAIAKAEYMYEFLTESEQAQVENKAILAEARFIYNGIFNEKEETWSEESESNRVKAIEQFKQYCMKNGTQLPSVNVYQIDIDEPANMSVLIQGEDNQVVSLSWSFSMTSENEPNRTVECITNLYLVGHHHQEEGKYYLYQSHTITDNGRVAKLKSSVNILPQSLSENAAIELKDIEKEGENVISEADIDVLRQTANLDLCMILKYFHSILKNSGMELSMKDFGFTKYVNE